MNPKSRKFRHLAFIRQGCRCFYCSLPIWETEPEQFTALYKIKAKKALYLKSTAEHLVAQQDGGADSEENIAAACLWCNQMRHFKRSHKAPDPMKYKRKVQTLVARKHWHPAAALALPT